MRTFGSSFTLCVCGTIFVATASAADPLPPEAPSVVVKIKTPRADAPGSLEIRVPKTLLIKKLNEAIPESVAVPDANLGDQLIYRQVKLTNIKASALKPNSTTWNERGFRIVASPQVVGRIEALYEHVVVTTEVRTIVGPIKSSVPVVRRDWRPKAPSSFEIDVSVHAVGAISFVEATDVAAGWKMRLKTDAEFVQIRKVEVKTDDVLVKMIKEVVAVVGKEFPNDGFNKPIKEALTRTHDFDPLETLKPEEAETFKKWKVADPMLLSTDEEIRITATLTRR